MQLRCALALTALSLVGSALANDNVLTIGSPAPAFKVEGWSKGTPVKELKAGQVYVVEFWATWCGPCIAAMPHLSELAKKYDGKATMVSINTWDYNKGQNEKEGVEEHVTRVNTWVKQNTDKMQYNVAFDDANDTMANTWMRAAGRNGIPCAFIVNEKSEIAWIGHPMTMDKPLEEIVNKTWDLAAFKEKFQIEQNKAIEAQENQKKLAAAAKTGNMAEFEPLMAKAGVMAGISAAVGANPDFAMDLMEKHAATAKDVPAYNWCSMAGAVASRSKSDAVKARAVKFSEASFANVEPKMAAIGAAYHARTLFAAGDKTKAIEWADKALTLVDAFEPAEQRPGVKKFIEDTKASFTAIPAKAGGGK